MHRVSASAPSVAMVAIVVLAVALAGGSRAADSIDGLAMRLASATAGTGHAELADVADRVGGASAEEVVRSLEAFAAATPAGANWLKIALDRAAERLGPALAAETLGQIVRDVKRPARARLLAFWWLKDRDAASADALLDALLDDPSVDLRREAVEKLLVSAAAVESADAAEAKRLHQKALGFARDVDQVERIAGWLSGHGEAVDVPARLGFVRRWRVSEAFDNAKGVGFAKAYPPESDGPRGPDTSAWKPVASSDPHGVVDLNALVGTKKGILAYAVAEVVMPRARTAEVRIGSPCAVAVWVNGRPVMRQEIYHASEAIDQYIAAAEFSEGPNVVMVKCCQNEQTEAWAVDWKFQLRICDELGGPLGSQPVAPGDVEATR